MERKIASFVQNIHVHITKNVQKIELLVSSLIAHFVNKNHLLIELFQKTFHCMMYFSPEYRDEAKFLETKHRLETRSKISTQVSSRKAKYRSRLEQLSKLFNQFDRRSFLRTKLSLMFRQSIVTQGELGRGPGYRDLERVPKYTQRVVAIL